MLKKKLIGFRIDEALHDEIENFIKTFDVPKGRRGLSFTEAIDILIYRGLNKKVMGRKKKPMKALGKRVKAKAPPQV